jgi:hypothetical protein
MSSEPASSSSSLQEPKIISRPSGIKVISIIIWVIAALTLGLAPAMYFLLLEIGLDASEFRYSLMTLLYYTLCYLMPFSILMIIAGIGVWIMKRWGFILTIFLLAIFALWSIYINVINPGTLISTPSLVITFIAIGVSYWLIKNRALFFGQKNIDVVEEPIDIEN